MQGQGGKQLYNGPLDAVKKLYQQGGLRSIYRGTGATLARDGPGSAACVAFFPTHRSAPAHSLLVYVILATLSPTKP